MVSIPALVVLALATYRVARIFTVDSISEPWIAFLYRWAWNPPRPGHAAEPKAGAYRTWIYELLSCPLCLGVWTSGALYALWRWGGGVMRGVVVVLAVAGVQAVLQIKTTEPTA